MNYNNVTDTLKKQLPYEVYKTLVNNRKFNPRRSVEEYVMFYSACYVVKPMMSNQLSKLGVNNELQGPVSASLVWVASDALRGNKVDWKDAVEAGVSVYVGEML